MTWSCSEDWGSSTAIRFRPAIPTLRTVKRNRCRLRYVSCVLARYSYAIRRGRIRWTFFLFCLSVRIGVVVLIGVGLFGSDDPPYRRIGRHGKPPLYH